jgi:hypothetical protein
MSIHNSLKNQDIPVSHEGLAEYFVKLVENCVRYDVGLKRFWTTGEYGAYLEVAPHGEVEYYVRIAARRYAEKHPDADAASILSEPFISAALKLIKSDPRIVRTYWQIRAELAA